MDLWEVKIGPCKKKGGGVFIRRGLFIRLNYGFRSLGADNCLTLSKLSTVTLSGISVVLFGTSITSYESAYCCTCILCMKHFL